MNQTCASCKYFERFANEKRGYCFGQPPAVFVSGSIETPKVMETRRACHLFAEIPAGETPVEKVKADPETPADAAKQARQGRKSSIKSGQSLG